MNKAQTYKKWILTIGTLLLLLLITIFIALSIGEVNLSPSDLIQILSERSSLEYTIVSQIRFPRIVLGLAIGGALSLSGVLLQGIYRNPLVEPYTLGISGGAALAVAFAIVFQLNTMLGLFFLPISGFIGALITVFLVYFLALNRNNFNINRMLLIGVMISFIASSAMMMLMSLSNGDNLQSIIFWIMGSLGETNKLLISIAFWSSISGLLISYMFVHPLNALRLGEEKAKLLGINTDIVIRILFVLASILTGACVSIAGIIGFVGLVIPHLSRLIVGNDYRILLITSFIGGGVFVILSDVLSRIIISPNELPIGVITGMVGGFVFVVVLSRSKFTSKS